MNRMQLNMLRRLLSVIRSTEEKRTCFLGFRSDELCRKLYAAPLYRCRGAFVYLPNVRLTRSLFVGPAPVNHQNISSFSVSPNECCCYNYFLVLSYYFRKLEKLTVNRKGIQHTPAKAIHSGNAWAPERISRQGIWSIRWDSLIYYIKICSLDTKSLNVPITMFHSLFSQRWFANSHFALLPYLCTRTGATSYGTGAVPKCHKPALSICKGVSQFRFLLSSDS